MVSGTCASSVGRKGKRGIEGHIYVYSHEVGKDDAIFECTGDPDQVQGILIHADLAREAGRVVAAQERSSVRIDADPEVADPDFQLGLADDVGYGGRDPRVDLRGIERRSVRLVVEGYEKDVGDLRRRRGAAGEQERKEYNSDGDEDHEKVVVTEEWDETWLERFSGPLF